MAPHRGLRPGQQAGNNIPGSQAGHKWTSADSWKHGMKHEDSIRARALAYREAMLSDPHCPDYLYTPAFASDFSAWSRREALASLALDYAEGILAEEGPAGLFAMRPGVMRSPAEVLAAMEEGAARARTKLGLNPAGYVRIARDYNLAQNTTANQLQDMAAEGAELVRRQLALEAGGDDGSRDEE